MSNKDSALLDILKQEYSQSIQRSIYLDGQANKYTGYIFAAFAAFSALYAFFSSVDGLSPIVLNSMLAFGAITTSFLLIMALHQDIQCLRVGGYIKYLEECINSVLGSKVIFWESAIAPTQIHKGKTTKLLLLTLGVLFLAFLCAIIWFVIKYLFAASILVSIAIILILILETIVAVEYLLDLFHAHELIYNNAKNTSELL